MHIALHFCALRTTNYTFFFKLKTLFTLNFDHNTVCMYARACVCEWESKWKYSAQPRWEYIFCLNFFLSIYQTIKETWETIYQVCWTTEYKYTE